VNKTDRLKRLYDRYNRMYFHGRLSYKIIAAPLPERIMGWCEWSKRAITIDLEKHTSDRQLRGTVLHEMAHEAANHWGHGIHFFAEVEKLLRQGAPITVKTAEGGKVEVQANLVPKRFPLLKRRMDRVEARRTKGIKDMVKAKGISIRDVTEDQIVENFRDVEGGASLPWRAAVRYVGSQFALTDETGRPLTAFSRRIIAKGHKVHARARRDYLEDRRIMAMTPEERLAEIAKLNLGTTA